MCVLGARLYCPFDLIQHLAFVTAMDSTMRQEFTKLSKKFEEFKKELLVNRDRQMEELAQQIERRLTQNFEKFKQEIISAKDAEIEDLKLTIANQDMSIKSLEDAKDWAEQYSRKDSVILSGPAVGSMTADEDTRSHVVSLIQDKLKIQINPNEISTTHRLGPIRRSVPGTPERRNIYVKFVRRDMKKNVIEASKKLRKNAPLVAYESLTERRRNMLRALQGMRKAFPDRVKGCTSMEGKLYAYTPPLPGQTRDHRHHIANLETLRDFCSKFVQKPLQDFLEGFSV